MAKYLSHRKLLKKVFRSHLGFISVVINEVLLFRKQRGLGLITGAEFKKTATNGWQTLAQAFSSSLLSQHLEELSL
jgi:acetylornithine/succinyldiaminopimelate/putrescine aminotransferase